MPGQPTSPRTSQFFIKSLIYHFLKANPPKRKVKTRVYNKKTLKRPPTDRAGFQRPVKANPNPLIQNMDKKCNVTKLKEP